jgi:hypothetical protein
MSFKFYARSKLPFWTKVRIWLTRTLLLSNFSMQYKLPGVPLRFLARDDRKPKYFNVISKKRKLLHTQVEQQENTDPKKVISL